MLQAKAIAQPHEISGQVIAAKTQQAIEGALLKTENGERTFTDSAGNFRLMIRDNSLILKVLAENFKTKNVWIGDFGEGITVYNVQLELETDMELTPTIISGSRFRQKQQEVTVSIEILKPQLIQAANTPKIDGIIDKVPGVTMMKGQVNIRGGSGFAYGAGSRVQMLVDDLPMLSADASDVKWDAIPVENIAQVEIIKGASSALYGSGALGGVINIRSAEATATPITKFQYFDGIYDSPKDDFQKYTNKSRMQNGLSFFHSRRKGVVDYTFGLYRFHDDGYRKDETFANERMNFSIKAHDPKFKMLSYGVSASLFTSRFGNFLFWADTNQAYIPSDGTLSLTQTFRYTIDPFVQWQTDRYKLSFRNRVFITDNRNNTGQNSRATLIYSEYQYQRIIKLREKDKLVWAAGIVNTTNTVSSDSVYKDHMGQNISAYLQGDLKWKRTNFSLGGRFEYNKLDTLPSQTFPIVRAGISQQLGGERGKGTFLRASFGTGYRFPSVAERYTSTQAGSIRIIPNPDIKAETGYSAEIGIRQAVKIQKWLGLIDVAVFEMRYKNMIEFLFGYYPPDPGIFRPQYLGFKPFNTVPGYSSIKGLEASVSGSGKIKNVMTSVLAGYTYLDPQYKDSAFADTAKASDKILKYRYRHSWKVNLDFTYKKWSLGGSFIYNSAVQNIDGYLYNAVKNLQPYMVTHNRGYSLLDLRMAYDINPHHKLSIVVKNVLNAEVMQFPGNMAAPRLFLLQYNMRF